MADVQLRGMAELRRSLKKLEPRIQKNILRGATRAVAKEIRDDARANAPVDTGNLRKNIMHRSRRGRRGISRASVWIREEGKRAVMKGGKVSIDYLTGRNAFYWRFVEYGHHDRGGNFIPGKHFITRAYERMRTRIDSVMASYVRKRIDKEIAKR